MEKVSIVFSIFAMSLVLYWHIQSKVNKREEAPFWWPVRQPDASLAPPLKDNWVRDGSKPPHPEFDGISETVLVIFDTGQKGIGYWSFGYQYWVARPNGHNERNTNRILAWQKFPDYEKI